MSNDKSGTEDWDAIMDQADAMVVTPEMAERFMAAIGVEPFVLADLAHELQIGPAEATATFDYILDEGLMQFQCTWVPIRKGDPLWIEDDYLKRRYVPKENDDMN